MNKYYGPEQEKVVAKYLETNDQLLFECEVYPLLRKIAYGVCGGKQFKPVSLFRSRQVIDGCVSHLWECLRHKYDKERDTKTFSYLTRCAFTYFCGVSRKYQKSNRTLSLVHKEVSYEWERTHLKVNAQSLVEQQDFFRFYYEDLASALKSKASQLKKDKPNSPKGKIVENLYKQLVSVRQQDYCDKYIHKKAIYSNTRLATKATTKQIRQTIKKELLPSYQTIKDENK